MPRFISIDQLIHKEDRKDAAQRYEYHQNTRMCYYGVVGSHKADHLKFSFLTISFVEVFRLPRYLIFVTLFFSRSAAKRHTRLASRRLYCTVRRAALRRYERLVGV